MIQYRQRNKRTEAVKKHKENSKKWLKSIDNDNKVWYNIITIKKQTNTKQIQKNLKKVLDKNHRVWYNKDTERDNKARHFTQSVFKGKPNYR